MADDSEKKTRRLSPWPPVKPGSDSEQQDKPTPPPPPMEGRTPSSESNPRFSLQDSRDRIPVAKPAPQLTTDSEPVRWIGPYAIYHEIARGGMGAVLYGEDPVLERRVAIKIMALGLADDEDAIRRFQREARATASIDHPNVARVYMVGLDEDGAPFLAMEYVDGAPLEQLIKDRVSVSWSGVCDLMIQASEGLRAAWKQGVVHRDIKPANLMITSDWKVKLVDFGLAKVFRDESFKTVAGMVMGTPRYMSPEQAQGREADVRSDVYSLGATFYHVACGRTPFDGDNPTQIMMKHVTSPLVPLRSLNPEVPMEFDEIVRRCMHKDANERYQDYADLVSDLERLKLQCTSREQGSIVNSIHDMPTVRRGPNDAPIPPASGNTANRDHMPEQEEESSDLPLWRMAILGGIVLLVVIAGVAMLGSGENGTEAPESVRAEPGKSGLTVLLERLIAEEQSDSADEVDPDYISYLATTEILGELGEALFVYQVDNSERARDLVELVESGSTIREFDIAEDGSPLDGWRNYLYYSRADQTIRSPGLDGRPNTPDDLLVDSEGDTTTDTPELYAELAETAARD